MSNICTVYGPEEEEKIKPHINIGCLGADGVGKTTVLKAIMKLLKGKYKKLGGLSGGYCREK